MKWGDTQNLLSVIIGLNIAYYAFRELRTPHLNRMLEGISDLRSEASEYVALKPESDEAKVILAELSFLHHEAKSYVSLSSSYSFQKVVVAFPSLFVAVMTVILLIHSTVVYETAISPWELTPIVLIGFAPVVFQFWISFASLKAAKHRFRPKYSELLDRFSRLPGARQRRLEDFHFPM